MIKKGQYIKIVSESVSCRAYRSLDDFRDSYVFFLLNHSLMDLGVTS